MPLTQDRDTKLKDGRIYNAPVAAAKKIFAGAMVALDASGNLVPGATATTLKGVGRAEAQVDNSAGAAGDKSAQYRKGVFLYANSASGDLITRADIGNDCYMVDDSTVAKTNGSASRSVAGKVDDVDSAGVWVKFS